MKIKVVDMPYEQALAQPREKHTPPRRPSMLFRTICNAVAIRRFGLVAVKENCHEDAQSGKDHLCQPFCQ